MNPAIQMLDGMGALATMATPAALLLANAMLILSTNQRLQSILDRVRETELTIAGADPAPEIADLGVLNDLLLDHARRARLAHRALLSLYSSAGLFAVVILSLGGVGVGLTELVPIAILLAFGGSALLLLGAALLITETWIGIKATDRRFASIMELCQNLSERRRGGSKL